ncbi:MAG TPA: hypothetical protein PKK99_12895, partial [Bacteroidia bacterium]|nr:hypothetical protein [Bacteroidia bacterium]
GYVSNNTDCDDNNSGIHTGCFSGARLNVDALLVNGTYPNITSAMADAQVGDTIVVYPGPVDYTENIMDLTGSVTDLVIMSGFPGSKYRVIGDVYLHSGWQISGADITGTVMDSGYSASGERVFDCKINGRVLGHPANMNFEVQGDTILNADGVTMMTLFRGKWIGNYIMQYVPGYYEITQVLSSNTPSEDSVIIKGNQFDVQGGGRTIAFWGNTQYVYVANNYLRTHGTSNAILYFRGLKTVGLGQNCCINNTLMDDGSGAGFFFQIGPSGVIELRNNLLINSNYREWNPGDVTFSEFKYNFTTNSNGFQYIPADPTSVYSTTTSIDGQGLLLDGSDAFNGGDPNPIYNDVNGTRNDAGAFGGQDPLSHYFAYSIEDDIYYQDADGDGYGNPAVSTMAYAVPAGYVTDFSDCNDANASIRTPEPYIVGAVTLPSCVSNIDSLYTYQVQNFQYADHVIAFSSEYSNPDYSASRILGAPDAYPAYGDNANAWAPLTQDASREYIEVGFNTAAPI